MSETFASHVLSVESWASTALKSPKIYIEDERSLSLSRSPWRVSLWDSLKITMPLLAIISWLFVSVSVCYLPLSVPLLSLLLALALSIHLSPSVPRCFSRVNYLSTEHVNVAYRCIHVYATSRCLWYEIRACVLCIAMFEFYRNANTTENSVF